LEKIFIKICIVRYFWDTLYKSGYNKKNEKKLEKTFGGTELEDGVK